MYENIENYLVWCLRLGKGVLSINMSSVESTLFLIVLPLKGFKPCDPCSLSDTVLSMKDLTDGLSLHPPFILCCPKIPPNNLGSSVL